MRLRGWFGAVEEDAAYLALNPVAQLRVQEQAFNGIRCVMGTETRMHVKDKKTAKETWEALFKKRAIGDKRMLRKDLEVGRFKKNEDILAYVGHATALRPQLLEACGVETDDKDFIDIVMEGLGIRGLQKACRLHQQ